MAYLAIVLAFCTGYLLAIKLDIVEDELKNIGSKMPYNKSLPSLRVLTKAKPSTEKEKEFELLEKGFTTPDDKSFE